MCSDVNMYVRIKRLLELCIKFNFDSNERRREEGERGRNERKERKK
jgi:hypothetical protein